MTCGTIIVSQKVLECIFFINCNIIKECTKTIEFNLNFVSWIQNVCEAALKSLYGVTEMLQITLLKGCTTSLLRASLLRESEGLG